MSEKVLWDTKDLSPFILQRQRHPRENGETPTEIKELLKFDEALIFRRKE